MTHYYKASGRFSPLSFVYFILVALIILPLLGLAYAYAIWYIPLIYILFLLTLGFGFGTGYLLNLTVIRAGKVRNTLLALLFGFLGGLFALYFHWAVWLDLVLNAGESYGTDSIGITVSNVQFIQVFSLAFNPEFLFSLMGEVNQVGTWGIGGGTVSGTILALIWAIEALVIVGLATYLPYVAAQNPFSETSNSWMGAQELRPFNFIKETAPLVALLEQSSPEAFSELELAKDLGLSHSLFTLYSSETGESYLSIENKTASVDNDGKTQFDSDEFVTCISLDEELTKRLLDKQMENNPS